MGLQYIDNLTNQPIPVPAGWTVGQPQYWISDLNNQYTFANFLNLIFGLPISQYTPQVYTLNIPISMIETQRQQLFLVISPIISTCSSSGIQFEAIGRFDSVDYSSQAVWSTTNQNAYNAYPTFEHPTDGVFSGSTLTNFTSGVTYMITATLPDGTFGICSVKA
jgi:hypothetical protein